MTKTGPVAIVGGGIAGLTAALCLARAGHEVDIIEQAKALDNIGAGIQLSPNATAILRELGLLPALEAVWTEPDVIALVDGKRLRTLAQVPAGAFARDRWQAPYAVLARASLQRVLVDAVTAQPLCRLRLAARLDDAGPAGIAAVTGKDPDLIVGADGVWSSLRQHIPGAGRARFSGNLAFRLIVPQKDAPAVFDPCHVTAFLGSKAHLVVYPLRETAEFNLVAIAQGQETGTSWDLTAPQAARAALGSAFAGWHADIRELFNQAPEPTLWPLHEVSDGAWDDGDRTILIGDAAHAMMPFAAQGAAMAIEDAFELAGFLAKGKTRQDALRTFAIHRQKRVARVRARGNFNRFAYHASGPVRIMRDLVLSRRRPEDLAAGFDWLYGYRPSA